MKQILAILDPFGPGERPTKFAIGLFVVALVASVAVLVVRRRR